MIAEIVTKKEIIIKQNIPNYIKVSKELFDNFISSNDISNIKDKSFAPHSDSIFIYEYHNDKFGNCVAYKYIYFDGREDISYYINPELVNLAKEEQKLIENETTINEVRKTIEVQPAKINKSVNAENITCGRMLTNEEIEYNKMLNKYFGKE